MLPLMLACALSACTWTEVRPTRQLPPEPSAATAPAIVQPPPAAAPAPAPAPEPKESAELTPLLPVLEVEAIEGASMATAMDLFKPASVEKCKPAEHGFMRVVITSEEDRTAMIVDPNSTVSAAMSECVLKALSIMDIDEVLEPSASDSTSQVQSVLNIRW